MAPALFHKAMKLSPGAVEYIHFVTRLEAQYIAQVSRFLGRERHALEICIEGVWRRVESAAGHEVRFQVPDLMLSAEISAVNKGNFSLCSHQNQSNGLSSVRNEMFLDSGRIPLLCGVRSEDFTPQKILVRPQCYNYFGPNGPGNTLLLDKEIYVYTVIAIH